jgi:type I restriction enzyme, S subunit
MNANTFLRNFDLLAEAPGGVPKLREMILQLAVRGKLVPQDLNDEPVDIEDQSESGLIEATALAPIFPIPPRWVWTRLGCVVDYNYGEKIDSQWIPADAWLLDLEDIEKDTSRLLQCVLAGDRQSTSTKSRFNAGDVLYGKLRPYLNKILVAHSDGYCTTEIVPMKPRKVVDPCFIVYALKSRDFLEYTAARSYGMKMPRLGTEDAKRAPFPLPPLAEQKRIVARVDELMKRCDKLEAQKNERNERRTALTSSCLHALTFQKPKTQNLKSETGKNLARILDNFPLLLDTPESVAELRKTILQLAIQGRLVPQDPKDEPAEALLQLLKAERVRLTGRDRGEGHDVRQVSKDIHTALPKGWVSARPIEIGRICGGGTPSTNKPYYWGGEIPWVSPKDMTQDEITSSQLTITKRATEETVAKLLPPESILIVARSGILRRTVPVAVSRVACAVNQDIKVIVPYVSGLSHYLQVMFKGHEQVILRDLVKKGMTVESLKYAEFEAYPFPLPPISEQKRIVAKVNELMVLCDALETKLTQSHDDADMLAAAVVHHLCNSGAGRLNEATA